MGALVKPAAEILARVPTKTGRVYGPARAKVRDWAITYGFTDASTGRLPAEVVAMYRALHPDGDR